MKHLQTVEQYMTYTPHTVNAGVALSTGHQMMKKFGIRHLPVLVAGKLVGILTERDVLLASALDPEDHLRVEDAMMPETYTVSRETPIGDVVEQMATHRHGCAIVCDGKGRVTGIFTAIDALRAMADTLNTKARKAGIAKGNVA